MIKLYLILLVLCSSLLSAQKSDLLLLKEINLQNEHFAKKQVQFLLVDSKNPIIKYNPLSLCFGTLLFGYQKILSPQFSAHCLYEPSCSEFSFAMIKEFGILKGIPLSADRLMRCNKLGSIDIHPIKLDVKSGKVKESTEMFKRK